MLKTDRETTGAEQDLLRPARREGPTFLNVVPTSVGELHVLWKVLPEYFLTGQERTPGTPPGPFRTEAAIFRTEPESGLRVTWFGHSSTLLELDRVRVLMDPVWEKRASPWQWFGPKRFFAPTIALEDLPQLDLVLLSHDHYDHLGEDTIRRLSKLPCAAEAKWVTSLGVGALLESWGVGRGQLSELNWMDAIEVKSARTGAVLRLTSLPSRHFSGRTMRNRFETLWASFALQGARHRVYFGADSGWWDGFLAIGEQFGPFDLTMLEIGAFHELWKAIHLGPDGAARAFQDLGGSGLLMPIHWGLFDLGLHPWRQPIERLEELARAEGIALWSPEPGIPTEVTTETPFLSDWWRASK